MSTTLTPTPQQPIPPATPSPLRAKSDILTRPGTPSFMNRKNDKKVLNPFSKETEGSTTPSISRRGLDIPGSITRHPQLTKTPSRPIREPTPSLPFQLLRPPKSAPPFRNQGI
ncbi:hypothetical protein JH06_4533 [Blastocystis sp. subtype 4]|uniref:hypothetical protein n=1 Tax=Blastocystis sp. subtype 4 TaxID=944170 RepID=UPI00071215F4|nr:hypothetical protein JH06_4533 [Blastocystis sp. subtype 4]KNB41945.1 hypothetical protein JH06_4533 [Blastocystis sp. subtype 4]|eukprot:XP_014525388.1 hypothetical protein JH06_4533 [Blastocystis sp. subtype 4]